MNISPANASALPRGQSMVQQLLQLQCQMKGACVRSIDEWTRWAEQRLPAMWSQCDGCALTLCEKAHQLFVEHSGSKFGDWQWDFLSSLFRGQDCNCVCGTLFLSSVAEYLGLWPEHIQTMVGPQHVWIRARKKGRSDDDNVDWWFLETTLRSHQAGWTMSQADGAKLSLYGRGSWFNYTDTTSIVHEAFINQLLLSLGQPAVRAHLLQLMAVMATQADPCRWILDLRQLRLRQLTSTTGTCSTEQVRLVESIVDTVSSSTWPPEAYLKTLLLSVRWWLWCRWCAGGSLDSNREARDDEWSERLPRLAHRLDALLTQVSTNVTRRNSVFLLTPAHKPLWKSFQRYVSWLRVSIAS